MNLVNAVLRWRPAAEPNSVAICAIIRLTLYVRAPHGCLEFYLKLWWAICECCNQWLITIQAAQPVVWTARWNWIICWVQSAVASCRADVPSGNGIMALLVPPGHIGASVVGYGEARKAQSCSLFINCEYLDFSQNKQNISAHSVLVCSTFICAAVLQLIYI